MHSLSIVGQLLSTPVQHVARCRRGDAAPSAPDRRPGLQDAGAVDRRGRALLLEDGYAAVTSRRVAATGRSQAAARPLLLPHDGRPLPRGLPPARRREPRAHSSKPSRQTGRLHNLWQSQRRPARRGVHDRVRRAREPPQGDPRRDRPSTPSVSAPPRSTPSRQRSPRAASPRRSCRRSSRCSLLTGLSQVLTLEDALGVTAGHDTTRAFIERTIAELERAPRPRPAATGRARQSGTSPRGSGKGRSA